MAYSDRQGGYRADGVHVLPLSLDSITALRSAWADLADDCADRNVFLEPWAVQAAIGIAGPNEADIVAFFEAGRLIGLAIFAKEASYARLPLGHYRSHVHAHQFLATPLVRQGWEKRFAAMLTGWLDRAPDNVTFCRFTHLPADGAVYSALKAHCVEDSRRCDIVQRRERPVLDARLDADGYLRTHVSSRRKKRLRRLDRRLAETGGVRFEQLKDPACLTSWIDHFLTLEHQGWKGQAGTAIKCRPAEVSFLRELAGEALRRDQLVFSRLVAGERAVAYALDLRSADRVFCLKVAYDPDFCRFSPGIQLEYHCLQHFLQDAAINCVDSCASAGNSSLTGLWAQSVSIVQLVIGRKGLRYNIPLGAARLLEQTSAIGTRMIKRVPGQAAAAPDTEMHI